MSKRLRLTIGAALTCAFCLEAYLPVQAIETIEINHDWQFRRVQAEGAAPSDWKPAEVPGYIHLDLMRNNLIPNPYYRDNKDKLKWIPAAAWEYRTVINATPELLTHRNIELVFDGLDAAADVTLNGKPILHADNQFRIWRVDVKPLLHSGSNELTVVFPPPLEAAEKVAALDPWRHLTHTKAMTYIRKAQDEYDAGFGPDIITGGIWRPVEIQAWDAARISDLYIRRRDVTSIVAHLTAQVEITAAEDTAAQVTIDYESTGKKVEASRTVQLHPGINHIDFPLEIRHPELWYPNGYGAQPLYRFHSEVRVGNRLEDQRQIRTGLRTVVLRQERDQWGRSFEFVVNGTPVFAKGADLTPFDSFPSRVTDAEYRSILQAAKDANMNMVRYWGGGYPPESFYAAADELGIMVQQDFAFGNDWQPGIFAWKQSVAHEVEDQVRRLRNHPSLVVWNGNNEGEKSFRWDKNKADPSAKLQMWQDYLTVFSGIIPRIVARLSPEAIYQPSSPSANYEPTSPQYEAGDFHEYDVWYEDLPFSDYLKNHYRFVSEFGFQSFPEMKSIEAFTAPEDRTGPLTPVLRSHNLDELDGAGPGGPGGSARIERYMRADYPQPKDFASFVYVSQVLQAEGVKVNAEHLRRDRPRSMGCLYWSLNNSWPAVSWSSIDYYGRWKALQYYARRFYSPVLVSPSIENGGLSVYIVSDKTQPLHGILKWTLEKFDGTVVKEKSEEVQIPALSSKIYSQVPMGELVSNADPAALFVTATLTVDGKTVSHNLIYLVPTKQVDLPPANIKTTLAKSGDGYRLTLSSPVLARDVRISFANAEAKLSDNYFDLLPGETAEIAIDSKASLGELKQQLQVISLSGAFKR